VTRRPFLALLAAACAMAVLGPASPSRAQDGEEQLQSRQILVMLRLAPAHFRPNGSYGGAYGDNAASVGRRRLAEGIARKAGLSLVDGWPMPLIGVDCYVMQLAPGMSVDAVIRQVSKDPMVAWSEPMQVYRTHASLQKGDPLFRIEPAASAWNLAELHKVATGRGIRVAIVDSKVQVDHPDLAGQFIADRDFVNRGQARAEEHGTGIAGVIAAKAGNGVGIAGVAPEARLMALRACWQGSGRAAATYCDNLSLARALQFAIEHGAEVINLSLAGPPDALLRKLIALALSRGTTVVAAFDPGLPGGGFPASQQGVIPVTEESLQSLPSGLYGAPGRDVPTTQPGGKWYLVNGSSYAAAHVSGLVALAREQRRSGASSALSLARMPGGTVDACATVVRTSRSCDCSCAVDRQLAENRRR
jgi:hypothetical protein